MLAGYENCSCAFKPVTLKATAVSAKKVSLTWLDKSANETAFTLERKEGACAAAGAWTQIKYMPAGSQAAADSTVTDEKTYSYRVRARTHLPRLWQLGFPITALLKCYYADGCSRGHNPS